MTPARLPSSSRTCTSGWLVVQSIGQTADTERQVLAVRKAAAYLGRELNLGQRQPVAGFPQQCGGPPFAAAASICASVIASARPNSPTASRRSPTSVAAVFILRPRS